MISPPLNIGIRYIIKCKDSANREQYKTKKQFFDFCITEVQLIFALTKIGKTYLTCKNILAKMPQRTISGLSAA